MNVGKIKDSQFLRPLLNSVVLARAAVRLYVKLVSQLFGDRAVIANATGCSSIYGGNLPTTPGLLMQMEEDLPGQTRCLRIMQSLVTVLE